MFRISWPVVLFVALQAVHKMAMTVTTRGRTPTTVRRGHLTTALWIVTFFVPLLAALYRLLRTDVVIGPGVFWAAMALIAVGVALRVWGLVHLRHFFSELIVIRRDHRLITTGPYRLLRHPLHVGMLVQILGFALIAGHWWTWVLFALAVVGAIPRELTEERTLRERFGPEYAAWHARTLGLTDLLPRS